MFFLLVGISNINYDCMMDWGKNSRFSREIQQIKESLHAPDRDYADTSAQAANKTWPCVGGGV
jgi:hypothetical protein